MDWKNKWEGKKVFIKLKDGSCYNGTVTNVDDDGLLVWINLLDKYGKDITILNSEIIKIVDETNG